MICDFCLSDAPLVKDYHPPDGKLIAHMPSGVMFVDDGNWGACAECVPLIDARNISELINRAVDAMIERGMITSSERERAKSRMQVTLHYILGVTVA